MRKKCTNKVMTKGTKTKYEWMKETCWTLKASKGFIGHFEMRQRLGQCCLELHYGLLFIDY